MNSKNGSVHHSWSSRALLVGAALGGSIALTSGHALADDLTAAANAFSQAQRAELGGDFDGAAEFYELADSAAPSPEALRSALRARKAAGQLGAAAAHAEKILKLYPNDKRSREVAEATLEEAGQKLVRYTIHCRPTACSVALDDGIASAATQVEHVLYLDPAEHQLRARFGTGQSTPRTVSGTAGTAQSLTFEAPKEQPPARAATLAGRRAENEGASDSGVAKRGGTAPWLFISGAIATVGLGAATVWSGLDTKAAHDDYEKIKNGDPSRARAAFDEGNDKELRTNILIGATAAAGVGTGVLFFLTNWGGSSEAPAQAHGADSLRVGGQFTPHAGWMTVRGRF